MRRRSLTFVDDLVAFAEEVFTSLTKGLLDLNLDVHQVRPHLLDFVQKVLLKGIEVDALVALLSLLLIDATVHVLFKFLVLFHFRDRLTLSQPLGSAHLLEAEFADISQPLVTSLRLVLVLLDRLLHLAVKSLEHVFIVHEGADLGELFIRLTALLEQIVGVLDVRLLQLLDRFLIVCLIVVLVGTFVLRVAVVNLLREILVCLLFHFGINELVVQVVQSAKECDDPLFVVFVSLLLEIVLVNLQYL